MTDHAPADHPTSDLPPIAPSLTSAYSYLDHRTRAGLIPEPTAPAGRYLAVEHGDELRLIRLARPIVHIGRGLIADVRLEDVHVSRRHAIVALRGDGVRVLDDRSASGTYVNGRRITIETLRDGDVLRIGNVALRYVEIPAQRRRRPQRRFSLGARTAREGAVATS